MRIKIIHMKSEINQTWHFNAPPSEVWDYLTKPELMEKWLMKNDFKPVPGHKFYFTSPNGCEHYCEVLEVNSFSRLSYSWQKKSDNDGKPFNSIVVWTLSATENGTELNLLHHGFVAIEDFIAHEKGWNFLVDKLKLEYFSSVHK